MKETHLRAGGTQREMTLEKWEANAIIGGSEVWLYIKDGLISKIKTKTNKEELVGGFSKTAWVVIKSWVGIGGNVFKQLDGSYLDTK